MNRIGISGKTAGKNPVVFLRGKGYFLLTFLFLWNIVCLLGLQVSVPCGTAEHRNGVRFPGEPVAVMAECFLTRGEKETRSSFSPVTHWHFPLGRGRNTYSSMTDKGMELLRLSRKTCLEGRMKSHGFLAFYAGIRSASVVLIPARNGRATRKLLSGIPLTSLGCAVLPVLDDLFPKGNFRCLNQKKRGTKHESK